MKSSGVRISLVELSSLVSWLNSLPEEERQSLRDGNSIIQLLNNSTGIGTAVKATVYEFDHGWKATNHHKDITDYGTW